MTERVAIVTGGTRGIGAAISELLAADGTHVAAVYARNHDAARELAGRLTAAGGSVSVHQGDIGDLDFCRALVAGLVRRPGTGGLPGQQRRAADREQGRGDDRRRVGRRAAGEPVRAVLPGPGRAGADDRAGVRPDRERRLGDRGDGQPGRGRVRSGQGGAARADPVAGPGGGPQGHHGQPGGAGRVRDRDDRLDAARRRRRRSAR